MPAPIPVVDRGKQVNDDWTTSDANGAIKASERLEEAGRLEHTAAGEHLLPAPEAVCRIIYRAVQQDYVVEWGKNIVGVRGGVGGIGSAGLVLITLANTLADIESVGLQFHAEGEGMHGAVVIASSLDTITMEIYSEAGVLSDASGLVEIYGLRLV